MPYRLLNNTLGGKCISDTGADLGEGAGGAHPRPPEMTCGFLIQLVFWFIGVEIEEETSAPPPPPLATGRISDL